MGTIHHLSTSSSDSAQHVLLELQVEQHAHDESYHREVARLPLHQRLNHLALHFAKYVGYIATASDDQARLRRVYTDIFIIALSTANTLNLKLWDSLRLSSAEYADLQALGDAISARSNLNASDSTQMLHETAAAAGKFAAACEKIDHLEDVSYRTEIAASIARLSELALAYAAQKRLDMAALVRKRLTEVKQRLALHGRI